VGRPATFDGVESGVPIAMGPEIIATRSSTQHRGLARVATGRQVRRASCKPFPFSRVFQAFARYFSQHSLRVHGMSYLLYMHVCSYDPEIRINLHEISALFRFEARV
jgi:hypothetical protein